MRSMLCEGDCVEDSSGLRWRVGGLCGKGSCCEVYRATSEHGSEAAVKIYKTGVNFEQAHDCEAMLLKLVQHNCGACPQIVTNLDEFDHGTHTCLLQEILGFNLRELIISNHSQPLSLHLVLKLTHDILLGLQCLHKCGFIHGDLKPSNLLWNAQHGCLTIIDYSLSCHVGDECVGKLQSQGYRAPEVDLWNQSTYPEGKAPVHTSTLAQSATPVHSITHVQTTPPVESTTPVQLAPPVECSTLPSHERLATVCSAPVLSVHHNTVSTSHNKLSLGDIMLDLPSDKLYSVKPKRAADLWSVGCIIIEMLTGKKVFTSESLKILQEKKHKSKMCEGSLLRWFISQKLLDWTQHHEKHVACHLMDLIYKCLDVDTTSRISAEDALLHPVFKHATALQEDILSGCESNATVVSCLIPLHGAGRGKVYVEFELAKQAEITFRSWSCRSFNGHSLILSYFPLDAWRAKTLF